MHSYSDDEEEEFKQRNLQSQQVLNQVKEFFVNQDVQNEGFLQVLQDLREDLIEELDEEYETEYKNVHVPDNINVDLVPMNEVQKAQIYQDAWPLLAFRKRLLILQKKISLLAYKFTKHPLFEFCALVIIVFNSIMLALDDPTTDIQTTFQDLMDVVFLVLYTVEAVLKIIALGFLFNQGAYLRDFWNLLDFVIIITGYLPYFVQNSGIQLNSLRSLRVLRPLRTISSIESLRNIMMTLFASFAELGNALIILGFTYTIFAIAGLQLFSGYAKQRCFNHIGIIQMYDYDTDEPYCSGTCPDEYICGRMLDNPIHGLLSFDDFGMSFLQVFIITTLEGWTTIQQAIMLTFSPLSAFYFLLLVVIGAFFLVNLTLAIIKINFSKAAQQKIVPPSSDAYSLKQLKRLGIYVSRVHNKSILQRKQTMKIRQHQPTTTIIQRPEGINNESEKVINTKVTFQSLNIKEFSRPHQMVNGNNRILLQGIQGVRPNGIIIDPIKESNKDTSLMKGSSASNTTAPMQIRKLSKLGTQFKQSQRRVSVQHQEESPMDELDQLLRMAGRRPTMLRTKIIPASPTLNLPSPHPSQQAPSSNSMLDDSQSPGKPPKYLNPQQFNWPDQKSFNENDGALSVTLSEVDSQISETEIQKCFREFEISFQVEKVKPQIQEIQQIEQVHHNRRRIRESVPIYEMSKEDEKLKIRLFQTQLIPHIIYREHLSDSQKDVLISQELKKQKQEQLQKEDKIRKMKISLNYKFNNSSQLQIVTPTQSQVESKTAPNLTMTKSKKILPIVSEFPSLQEISTPMQYRKQQKRKSYVKILQYEQYQNMFKDEEEEIKDNKLLITTTNDIKIKTPNEKYFYDYSFYQQYHQLKVEDINSNGNINGQCSIEDVLVVKEEDYKICNIILKAINYKKAQYMIYMINNMFEMLQYKTSLFVESQLFIVMMNLAVAINTIILALDGLIDDSQTLDNFNLAFTIIFTIEMCIKVFGNGVLGYIKDIMNIFDAIIVALSLIDIFFLSGSSVFKSVKIFRAFRVLRVTKLMRSLTFMNFLVQVLSNAFSTLMYIFLLLVLFVYIFTLLGMSFFGGQLTYTPSRQSYDTFYESFLVVFQVLTLENWNSLLYDLLQQPVSWALTLIYLISWIFIGSYVLLNLFLASLLDQFEIEYLIEFNSSNQQEQEQYQSSSNIQSTQKITSTTQMNQTVNPVLAKQILRQESNQKFLYFSEPGICIYSLGIFSQSNSIRRFCYRSVKTPYFEQIILFAIFLSSLKLVIDTYVGNFLVGADWFFAIFFGIEFLFKIIAYGFVTEEATYLRDYWNILDFIIVVCSFIDISVASINLSFVKILRLLRTLRPLRLISQNKSMKLLVTTLINSITGIMNVGVVVILIFLMFAILGVNLERGKLHYCDTGDDEETSYLNSYNCTQQGYTWSNRNMNMDNVFSAMLSLFVLSTQEGWPTQMYWYIDADENGPIKNNQVGFSAYFIIFLLIGSILLMNLFVGVILVNYKLAEDDMKDKNVSRDQEDWLSIQKLIIDSNPNFALFYPPQNKFRAKIYNIISNKIFDITIMGFIIINIIAMSADYEDSSTLYEYVLQTINTSLSGIFITEAILKIIGFGPKGYFRNNWNRFDFFVVVSSIVDIVLSYTDNKSNPILAAGPQIIRVFRVLRVTRLFRLIKSLRGLKKLIDTALFSLPALINVSALMFLLYFIFSVLGVFLFSDLSDGEIINSDNNFNNFHEALLLLFRCTTGEDWYLLMYDVMDKTNNYYSAYFIIFVVIMQRIMLNLFVLIILDQYERFYFNQDNPLQRFQEFEDDFVEGWATLASETKGQFIHQEQLITLMLNIKSPLGYDLKEKMNTAINDWKTYNADANKSQQNIEKLKIMITTDAKKYVARIIMGMQLDANENKQLEYHYVLYAFMKNFQKDLFKDMTLAGAKKLQQREDQTLNKIKKNRSISEEVNPCVSLLFQIMCFKAFKRYAIKLREHMARQIEEEFSRKSSDTSYLHKSSEIQNRDSISQSIESIQESKQQFCLPPDVGIYQSEVNILLKDPSQNTNTKPRGSVQQLIDQKLENISEFQSDHSISFNNVNDVSNY